MTDNQLQKPFLKWVGGKTQILQNVLEKFPKEMNNYHELFLGGGSVLLAVLSLQKQGKIIINNKCYAYDNNAELINVYKHVQKNKDELLQFIEAYIKEYDSIQCVIINRKPTSIDESKSSKESYYYWIRHKYNNMDKDTIECSALFMIINKLCFRGMHRVGPNGYNVPYGHYKTTPIIICKNNMDYISNLIKDVIFVHCDFKISIKNIITNDFVYLDPPYAPITEKSFVKYTEQGFGLDAHKKLFSDIKELNNKNIKFVMSNAKVEFVVNEFKEFNCEDIKARRAINSKNPGSTTTEVLIYN